MNWFTVDCFMIFHGNPPVGKILQWFTEIFSRPSKPFASNFFVDQVKVVDWYPPRLPSTTELESGNVWGSSIYWDNYKHRVWLHRNLPEGDYRLEQECISLKAVNSGCDEINIESFLIRGKQFLYPHWWFCLFSFHGEKVQTTLYWVIVSIHYAQLI